MGIHFRKSTKTYTYDETGVYINDRKYNPLIISIVGRFCIALALILLISGFVSLPLGIIFIIIGIPILNLGLTYRYLVKSYRKSKKLSGNYFPNRLPTENLKPILIILLVVAVFTNLVYQPSNSDKSETTEVARSQGSNDNSELSESDSVTSDELILNTSEYQETTTITETEPQTSTQIETTTQITTQPQTTIQQTTELRTEPITEVQTQPQTQVQTQPQTEVQTQPQIQTQPQTEVQIDRSVSVAQSDTQEQMVWIPTNGGTKYHSSKTCSNMIDPEYVTITEAKNRGFEPCKRCH